MTARTLANSHPTLFDLLTPGMSVLDVGCGPGALTIEIARRVSPAPVVGMDISPAMILAAEAASAPGAIPNLVFYAATSARAPGMPSSRWRRRPARSNGCPIPTPPSPGWRRPSCRAASWSCVTTTTPWPSGAVNARMDAILLGVPRLARGGRSRQCDRQALARARGGRRPRRRRHHAEITTVHAGTRTSSARPECGAW